MLRFSVRRVAFLWHWLHVSRRAVSVIPQAYHSRQPARGTTFCSMPVAQRLRKGNT
jgi:hypothetical protein